MSRTPLDSPWTGAMLCLTSIVWEGFWLIGPPVGLTTHDRKMYLFWGLVALAVSAVQSFLVLIRENQSLKAQLEGKEGWFAFEVSAEIHPHIPFELIIRNCGPRPVRDIRFDPIASRQDLKIWLQRIASLTLGERLRVGYSAGDNAEYPGLTGHIINFFEGGSSVTDQPPYPITIHFLDGQTRRSEKHIIEGHPLPKGGVGLKTYPLVPTTPPPSLRAKIVPVRFDRTPDNRYGLFVRNHGEPAFDISMAEPIMIGASRLIFWDRTYSQLDKDGGELFMEAAIERAGGGGLLVGSPRDQMIEAGLEKISMAIQYRDLDNAWITEFDLIREIWGRGLRVGSVKQRLAHSNVVTSAA